MSLPFRLELDGETFELRESLEQRGTVSYKWVSGMNPGYGFTSRSSNGQLPTEDEMKLLARNFIAQADPATGYIED